MFAQPGEMLKAVGLAARTGRDPFLYFRDVRSRRVRSVLHYQILFYFF